MKQQPIDICMSINNIHKIWREKGADPLTCDEQEQGSKHKKSKEEASFDIKPHVAFVEETCEYHN